MQTQRWVMEQSGTFHKWFCLKVQLPFKNNVIFYGVLKNCLFCWNEKQGRINNATVETQACLLIKLKHFIDFKILSTCLFGSRFVINSPPVASNSVGRTKPLKFSLKTSLHFVHVFPWIRSNITLIRLVHWLLMLSYKGN